MFTWSSSSRTSSQLFSFVEQSSPRFEQFASMFRFTRDCGKDIETLCVLDILTGFKKQKRASDIFT